MSVMAMMSTKKNHGHHTHPKNHSADIFTSRSNQQPSPLLFGPPPW